MARVGVAIYAKREEMQKAVALYKCGYKNEAKEYLDLSDLQFESFEIHFERGQITHYSPSNMLIWCQVDSVNEELAIEGIEYNINISEPLPQLIDFGFSDETVGGYKQKQFKQLTNA